MWEATQRAAVSFAEAIMEEVGDRVYAALVENSPALNGSAPTGWLDTRAAAAYAGCSPNVLHKATAAREVHFEQDVAGGKCWFRREWIDAWRQGESASSPPS